METSATPAAGCYYTHRHWSLQLFSFQMLRTASELGLARMFAEHHFWAVCMHHVQIAHMLRLNAPEMGT